MQILKKERLLLLIGFLILFVINIAYAQTYFDRFTPFPFITMDFYKSPLEFYNQFPFWPDTIVITILFVLLMKGLLERTQTLGERGTQVGGILGLIMGLSLSIYFNAMDFHALRDLGPIVLTMLVIYLLLTLYKWARSEQKHPTATLLFILAALLFILGMIPQVMEKVPFLSGVLPILLIILIIAFIMTLFGGLPVEYSGGASRRGSRDGNDDNENMEAPDYSPTRKGKLNPVIYILNENKSDEYGPNTTLELAADVKMPFFSRGKFRAGDYSWQWSTNIREASFTNPNEQRANLILPAKIIPGKYQIFLIVKDNSTEEQGIGKRKIRLVHQLSIEQLTQKPTVTISEPAMSKKVKIIPSDSNEILRFLCLPLRRSMPEEVEFAWYIINSKLQKINQNIIRSAKFIGKETEVNTLPFGIGALKLNPGEYTIAVAGITPDGNLWLDEDNNYLFDVCYLTVIPPAKKPQPQPPNPQQNKTNEIPTLNVYKAAKLGGAVSPIISTNSNPSRPLNAIVDEIFYFEPIIQNGNLRNYEIKWNFPPQPDNFNISSKTYRSELKLNSPGSKQIVCNFKNKTTSEMTSIIIDIEVEMPQNGQTNQPTGKKPKPKIRPQNNLVINIRSESNRPIANLDENSNSELVLDYKKYKKIILSASLKDKNIKNYKVKWGFFTDSGAIINQYTGYEIIIPASIHTSVNLEVTVADQSNRIIEVKEIKLYFI